MLTLQRPVVPAQLEAMHSPGEPSEHSAWALCLLRRLCTGWKPAVLGEAGSAAAVLPGTEAASGTAGELFAMGSAGAMAGCSAQLTSPAACAFR